MRRRKNAIFSFSFVSVYLLLFKMGNFLWRLFRRMQIMVTKETTKVGSIVFVDSLIKMCMNLRNSLQVHFLTEFLLNVNEKSSPSKINTSFSHYINNNNKKTKKIGFKFSKTSNPMDKKHFLVFSRTKKSRQWRSPNWTLTNEISTKLFAYI